MYEYSAIVLKCVDGDTVDAQLDLGFNVYIKERFRLIGINAPEMHGESKVAGLVTQARLKELIEGKIVTIQSHKVEKYGRWLARIWLPKTLESVNDLLVRENLATPYMVEDLIFDKG